MYFNLYLFGVAFFIVFKEDTIVAKGDAVGLDPPIAILSSLSRQPSYLSKTAKVNKEPLKLVVLLYSP